MIPKFVKNILKKIKCKLMCCYQSKCSYNEELEEHKPQFNKISDV